MGHPLTPNVVGRGWSNVWSWLVVFSSGVLNQSSVDDEAEQGGSSSLDTAIPQSNPLLQSEPLTSRESLMMERKKNLYKGHNLLPQPNCDGLQPNSLQFLSSTVFRTQVLPPACQS